MARDYLTDDLGYSWQDQMYPSEPQGAIAQAPNFPDAPQDDAFREPLQDVQPAPVAAPTQPTGSSNANGQPTNASGAQAPNLSSLPLANTPSGVNLLTQKTNDIQYDGGDDPYTSAMDAMRNAPDEQAYHLARNELQRRVYGDLQQAGHDVKWQGDALIVDGLPYEIGDGGFQGGEASGPASHDVSNIGSSNTGINGGGYSGPKDLNSLISYYQSHNQVNTGIDGLVQFLQQNGINAKRATHSGMASDDAIEIDGQIYDEIQDVGGLNQKWQHMRTGGGGGMTPSSLGARPTMQSFGGQLPGVAPYQPSYEELLKPDQVDQALESKLIELMNNPESLDPHTIEVLKAKAKDEATQLLDQEQGDITRLEYEGGVAGSPWAASQRLNANFNRDVNLAKGNQAIDIQAAQGRMADRRAALDAGLNFAAQKQNKRQFAELAKQRATELGISQQQVMAQFTLGMLDASLKKYGMDLDGMLKEEGLSIDWQRLDQQDAQFWADLSLRAKQLEETARQFDQRGA